MCFSASSTARVSTKLDTFFSLPLTASDKTTEQAEAKWEEIKQYWDPNPQLKGTDLGRHAPKVCERAAFFVFF